MTLTITLDIDPKRSDGPHSQYQHLQEIVEPLLKAGWVIHDYNWRVCDGQAVIVMKWAE